jgi:hypothetical protein
VEGLRRNSKCILSLHFVRLFFQLYILLDAKTQAHVKAALDAVEAYCGGAFPDVFPVILGDRGSEFLDYLKKACEVNPEECHLALAHLFPQDLEPEGYYEYIKKKINR